jgi:hypothetical protein
MWRAAKPIGGLVAREARVLNSFRAGLSSTIARCQKTPNRRYKMAPEADMAISLVGLSLHGGRPNVTLAMPPSTKSSNHNRRMAGTAKSTARYGCVLSLHFLTS